MTIGRSEPQQRPLTVEDLQRMPDDGRRYELVGGRLDVSPAPVSLHTRIETRLSYHLTGIAPDGYEVQTGPGVNFNADRTDHRIPDVAVFREEDFEEPYFTRPPLLAVEVVSPDSIFRDNHTKRSEYEKFGIESYWIINPLADKPGLLELRLVDGAYREVSQVFGMSLFETDAPFPVKFVPHWLVADGAWKTSIGGEHGPD
ncbi:Uma2 family endonuclease [Nocardiopsis gilva YIM 90087]|uniref:Uma2 family endonuclease n=2 Tax=Nocardiopsis gilva TaxID=280236 RepID=A0A223SDK4_9ACTN|nr:Uma2 family endonuclease [Nocardiopsis gilva YIM 90087]